MKYVELLKLLKEGKEICVTQWGGYHYRIGYESISYKVMEKLRKEHRLITMRDKDSPLISYIKLA